MNEEQTSENPSCDTPCGLVSVPRRTLLGAVSGAVASMLWSRFAVAGAVSAVPLKAAPVLKDVGGSIILKVKDTEILFIRDTEATVVAVNPTCTHKANLLSYDAEKQLIVCKKHDSRFRRTGEIVKGPSKKPLTKFYKTKLDLENERVLVIL